MRTMKRSRSLALLVLALLGGSVLGSGVLLAEPLVGWKARWLWSSGADTFEVRDHHFGVGVEVTKPQANEGYARRIRYRDLGLVEHLRDDRAPRRAEAWVNGQLYKLKPNASGDLEVHVPSDAFHLLQPNHVTVQGYDALGNELAVFELGGCRFL